MFENRRTLNRLATAPKMNLFCRLWKYNRSFNISHCQQMQPFLKICLWIHLGKVELIGSRCRLDMVGKEKEEEEEEEKDTRRKLIGKFYSRHSGRFHIFSARRSPIELVFKSSWCSCETMTCRQAIGWVLLFDGAQQARWSEPVPFPERKSSQSTSLEFVEIWTFCFLFSLVCMFWEGKRH